MPPKVVKIRGIKTLPIAEEPGPCLSDFSRDRESKKRVTRAGEVMEKEGRRGIEMEMSTVTREGVRSGKSNRISTFVPQE